MALSDYFYPEHVTALFGKDVTIKGSLDWTDVDRTEHTNYDTYYAVGSIIDVDYSALDPLVNISPETGLKRTIFTFKNNLELVGYFYVVQVTDPSWTIVDRLPTYRVNCLIKVEYNGEQIVIPSGTPTGGFSALYNMDGIAAQYSTRIGYPFWNAGEHKIVRLIFNTRYRGQGVPIPGVTHPSSVGFNYFYQTVTAKYDQSTSTNRYAGDNDVSKLVEDEVVTRLELYRVGVPTTEDDGMRPISAGDNLIAITDMEEFNTYMHTVGDEFRGDIFSRYEDPEDDTSGTGGGGGHYDDSSDPIDFPGLPTGGALASGLVKGYLPSSAQLAALQNKLWDGSFFDYLTWQKLVSDPINAMIMVNALPFQLTAGTNANIKLGNYDSGISSPTCSNQYITIDCGSLKVPEYWGSALDYAPYCKIEIFLPFIGIRPLKIEDVVNNTIAVKYNCDGVTGHCVAFVKCGKSVLYTFVGNCAVHVPITQNNNYASFTALKAAVTGVTALAMGSPASAVGGAISGAINVATSKDNVTRSGDMAGDTGLLGEFVPYLIIHRPKQSLAKNFKTFKGYPSNITAQLSALSGYTEIEYIHLDNIPNATGDELNEIERLLKEGVIL